MLFRATAEREKRLLIIVGLIASCIVAITALVAANNPFSGRTADQISVVLDAPYVGQGVVDGTALVMHGVTVGKVTNISSLSAGGVRLKADLEKEPVAGLTDAMDIDFRPINYFGVTGINIIDNPSGEPLRDGARIAITPKGNFTLQALLSRLGELSSAPITTQLIQVIDKATRYTDALNPLTETMLIVANAFAETQTVPTAQMLANVTGVSVAFPSFVDALTDVGAATQHGNNLANYGTWNVSDETYQNVFIPFMDEASIGLFGAVGKLEASHVGDLTPLVDSFTALTNVVPPLIRPEGVAETLVELRSRLEKMYGGSAEQRAMQVQIILDSLPGVAAPVAAMGGF